MDIVYDNSSEYQQFDEGRVENLSYRVSVTLDLYPDDWDTSFWGRYSISKYFLMMDTFKAVHKDIEKNYENWRAINIAYNEYKADFKGQKEVKAKHILVDSESKAKDVISQLKKGKDFDSLAKKYSKDKAVDLGYFTKKMMVPEFSEAAFATKKGTFTKTPVKTQYGYHVILVEDIRDAKPLPMKDIEPQLKGMLTQQAIGEIFADLYKNGKVTKYDMDGNEIKDAVVMPKSEQ